MKEANMKMDNLDFLSLPWSLSRNLEVEKSVWKWRRVSGAEEGAL